MRSKIFLRGLMVLLLATVASIATLVSAEEGVVDPTFTQFLGATPTNAEVFNKSLTDLDRESMVAAEASMLAYTAYDAKVFSFVQSLVDSTRAPEIGNYSMFTQIMCEEDKVARGFVATKMVNGEKVIIISFRGTANGSDFGSDMNALLWATLTSCGHKIHCHRGVYKLYRRMKEQIYRAVDEAIRDGGTRIWITGHSLGGGVAGRCALDLKDRYQHQAIGNNIKLVTFSSMALFGTESRAKEATSILGDKNIVRYDPEGDMVPRVGAGIGVLAGNRLGSCQRCFSIIKPQGKLAAHNLGYHCAAIRLSIISKYNEACESRECIAISKWDRAQKRINAVGVEVERARSNYEQARRRGDLVQAEQWAACYRRLCAEILGLQEEQRQANVLQAQARDNWGPFEAPNLLEWTMKKEVKALPWEPEMASLEKTFTKRFGGNIPSQELDSERLAMVRKWIEGR